MWLQCMQRKFCLKFVAIWMALYVKKNLLSLYMYEVVEYYNLEKSGWTDIAIRNSNKYNNFNFSSTVLCNWSSVITALYTKEELHANLIKVCKFSQLFSFNVRLSSGVAKSNIGWSERSVSVWWVRKHYIIIIFV